MKSEIGVGIIGYGTVGTGVARVLLDNASLIQRRVGIPIKLVGIADLDILRDRGLSLPPGILTTRAKDIIDNPHVDVVVELIGGYDAAKRVLLDAMAKGKQVVRRIKRYWPCTVRRYLMRPHAMAWISVMKPVSAAGFRSSGP